MERIYLKRIRQDDTLKDIETVMVTKENKIMEVTLTMSPIKKTRREK